MDRKKCTSCQIRDGKSEKSYQAKRYHVKLDGGWMLNHCGSPDSYLGYLILQTNKHVIDLEKLDDDQAKALGTNIRVIDSSLRKYWRAHFPDDPIERVHVAYLNEGPFIDEDKNTKKSHVHLHILPRTKGMMPSRERSIIGWCLVYLVGYFPEYLRGTDEERTGLMTYLKRSLPTSKRDGATA